MGSKKGKRMKRQILKWIGLLTCLWLFHVPASAVTGLVYTLRIDGVIDPITAEYVNRGIDTATKTGANALIIEMDTPGGLDLSMRKICQSILNSPVPVIVYVYPTGSRAASAGVFITLSSHLSAMAPGTNIGAAHPVDQKGEKASDKITNDAAAYARSIALKRNKNADWAEKAVRDSLSLSEDQAFAQQVIDIQANDLNDLLAKLNGKQVSLPHADITLNTQNARVVPIEMSWRENFFHTLANPNVAVILLLVGIYGIIFELATPGLGFAGIGGGICLLLALVSIEALPFNFAGLILILAATVLFIVEVKTPTHGMLTLGGILTMIFGIMLIFSPAGTPQEPYISARVSWITIIIMTLLTTAFFVLVVTKGLQAIKRPPALGLHLLKDAIGIAKTELNPEGIVHVQGEEWRAISDEGKVIHSGSKVQVVQVEGLTLHVKEISS
jgi:membrane-bound serine protease (ClpP class)